MYTSEKHVSQTAPLKKSSSNTFLIKKIVTAVVIRTISLFLSSLQLNACQTHR
uniref:Uncharacterized protein n=1 Tax=Arundo donax TaxID=35708 RepID=A0A0A9BN21_ARUDO